MGSSLARVKLSGYLLELLQECAEESLLYKVGCPIASYEVFPVASLASSA